MPTWSNMIEDRASEIKGPGAASAGSSPFAAAADHVHPGGISFDPSAVPGSHDSPGVKGQIVVDESFIYVCVDTDTWKRVEIETWLPPS